MTSRVIGLTFVASVLVLAALPAFYQQTLGTALSDIPIHFSLTPAVTTSSYSILAVLVRSLLAAGADVLTRAWVAILLLTAFIALKGVISFQVLSKDTESWMRPVCIALALAFVMPIANWWHPQSIYLGQIAPTVWHNSTTILAMPVVIVLFFAAVRSLREPTVKNLALTSGACLLCALIKPSYVLGLLPVLLAWHSVRALRRDRAPLRQVAAHAATLAGPALALIVVQSWLVVSRADSGVIVAPFAVWSLYSPNIPTSLLLSIAFPVAVSVLYRDRFDDWTALILAWSVFAVALAEFILLAEPGPRMSHANFLWGACMALFILFLICADVFFRQPMSGRAWPVFGLFLLHLASGLYFYARIVTGWGYA